jgi:antitoxin PrlF
MRAVTNMLIMSVDPSQAWFWTPEWQAGEREADKDIATGRTVRFYTVE